MMPAAPLVGAVTTRPPAAFSSLTASANRVTQSMLQRVLLRGLASAGGGGARCARRRDLEAAGQHALRCDAARARTPA